VDPARIPERTQGRISKLIQRAEASGAWNSALEYAQEHFQDLELTFARQQIQHAREQAALQLEQRQAS
jgi:hypothetical protein